MRLKGPSDRIPPVAHRRVAWRKISSVSTTTAATITPARHVSGRIRVPGDKSISHRYALIAALAEGTSRLANYAPGADCRSTLACLRGLGVAVTENTTSVTIIGRGLGRLGSPSGPLDAGNSGTTIRLMAGVLAGHAFVTHLGGDASLSRRPMRRVIEPLQRMGARIEAADGRPPLTIHGAGLHAITHQPDVPSAQVKSAVLLAGLHADGTTIVVEPARTRDHTERALPAFGGHVLVDAAGTSIAVTGGQRFTGQTLAVPGDFSSAAFWMVAAAACPGSRVEIEDVGLNPTRTDLLAVLRRFGARVEIQVTSSEAGEPRGTVVVEGDRIGSVEIGPEEVPGLIDELPAIAALAGHGGEVSVRGALELRVKESDRIAALVAGFRALGIPAEELPDGFVVGRSGRLAAGSGQADARGDHRMAMAFAIAALAGDSPSQILGADSVVISYPGFFETLGQLVA
jgi:3-phosphoshikimate 1-carboxyvinyltransferase